MSIFGLFFFIIVFILLFGFSILSSIVKTIFGWGRKVTEPKNETTSQQQSGGQNNHSTTPKRKKVFDEDEGEYVEFEEIKEE